ncbi:MAG: TonB-dependent receptor plug domain-containing protein, partial [Pseudomonadota bacterium]
MSIAKSSNRQRAFYGMGLLCLGGINSAIAAEESLSEVVVTGSRLIQNGFQAPTPVTVVTAEQLQATAPSTLSDAVNQLPVFSNSFKPASTGPGVVSNAGGAYLNARSLGANRNLVLLDGRRMVPSSVSGSVAGATDINIIPQSLVQRVDVVTGGASAAYGS